MQNIEFKMSLNTTGEVSSSNPAIRFAKSKVGASMLLFVSLLWPIESFSQNCQLKASPICVDSTPCKDVVDSSGSNVKVCLSSAIAPVGALVTSQTCWQYKAAYDCMNQVTPAYSDTCKQIKNGTGCTNYAETSVVCNPNEPNLASGACSLFDVTYQCETAPGTSYAETKCSSPTSCTDANGNPSFCTGPVEQEINAGFAVAVAGTETAREAGVYMDQGVNPSETDLTKLTIFTGERARCSEGMWGAAPNCCKHQAEGASATNALIAQELIGAAYNAVSASVGSSYVYDTLLTKTISLLQKGIEAISAVYSGLSSGTSVATTLSNISNAGAVGSQASGTGTLSTAAMAGGAIGGYIGGQAGSYIAVKGGANTGWAGTLSALGSAAGTYVGTYAGAYAAAYIGAYAGGASAAAAGTAAAGAGTSALGTLGWVGLIIMVIVMIIMSFAACAPEDYETMLKLGAPGICHYVGTYCNTHDFAGGCITTMQSYCCFNSHLAKLVQEGAKQQSPDLTWGTPEAADCSGIKVSDLANIDFSKIDLSPFLADIAVRTLPNGTDEAASVQNITQGFMAANNFDPTATDGQLISGGGQLAPLAPIVQGTQGSTPAMMTCNVVSNVTGIAADGSETGRFDVTQCNPGAVIVWSNVGNCVDSPVTSMDPASPGFLSSMVDNAGMASINMGLPATCFIATSPSIQNIWKGYVTLQPYGTIGVINAIW